MAITFLALSFLFVFFFTHCVVLSTVFLHTFFFFCSAQNKIMNSAKGMANSKIEREIQIRNSVGAKNKPIIELVRKKTVILSLMCDFRGFCVNGICLGLNWCILIV